MARTAIFEYMGGSYNTRKRHSVLRHLIPGEFEEVKLGERYVTKTCLPNRGKTTGRFDRVNRPRAFARNAVASIRLLNGTAAMFAPTPLARRLGVDAESNPAALHVLRLFGVRTLLKPYPAESMEAYPVSRRVNTVLAVIAQTRRTEGGMVN